MSWLRRFFGKEAAERPTGSAEAAPEPTPPAQFSPQPPEEDAEDDNEPLYSAIGETGVALQHVATGTLADLRTLSPCAVLFGLASHPDTPKAIRRLKAQIESGAAGKVAVVLFEESREAVRKTKANAWYYDDIHVLAEASASLQGLVRIVPFTLIVDEAGRLTETIDGLPDPPDQTEDMTPRSAQAAAERLLALISVVSRAHEVSARQTLKWVNRHGIDDFFSDRERAFYFLPEQPDHQQVVKFSWRVEAMAALIWALEGLDAMPPLNEQFGDIWQVPMVQAAGRDPAFFLSGARLRPAAEIKEMEADLYHAHWRVRDAQLFGKKMPEDLEPGIVYERRYALSWLVGWGDDWDAVPTDT